MKFFMIPITRLLFLKTLSVIILKYAMARILQKQWMGSLIKTNFYVKLKKSCIIQPSQIPNILQNFEQSATQEVQYCTFIFEMAQNQHHLANYEHRYFLFHIKTGLLHSSLSLFANAQYNQAELEKVKCVLKVTLVKFVKNGNYL